MESRCATVTASRSGVRRSASSGNAASAGLDGLGSWARAATVPNSRPTTLLLIERTCSTSASNATSRAKPSP
jgi:hypothetical protein